METGMQVFCYNCCQAPMDCKCVMSKPEQIENVRRGERREITLHEFEQFQRGQLRFDCEGVRMKPQKVKHLGFENTHFDWWVEFQEWTE